MATPTATPAPTPAHGAAKKAFITRRRAMWVLAVVVVVAAIAGAVMRPPPPPMLLTATIVRGDIVRAVLATGTVEATDLVSVGAQASGQIRSLRVKLGQKVRAGDPIAEIESTNQRSALRNAEAAMVNVRAQRAAQRASLVQAETALGRQQALVAGGAIARADVDAARAARDVAQAQLEAFDAQIAQSATSLDTARANLGYTRIVAPIDGSVVAIVASEGQTVNAVQSSPTIVKLASLDAMTVEAEISEADVIHVRPGLPAFFTILGDPGRRFPGTVRDVEPAPESVSGDDARSAGANGDEAVYYNGLFDVPNRDGVLRIGMTAQVEIELARAANVLIAPFAALGAKRGDGRYTVRVLDAEGRAVERVIRVGMNNRVDVQVLSGLREGERVVIGEAAAKPASASWLPPPPAMPGGGR